MDHDPPAKATPRLAAHLAAAGRSDVEVVVELRPVPPPASGSRQERVAAARAAFDAGLTPVTARIAEVGGTVLETAWINQTVRVRLPAAAVGALAAVDEVAGIDLPRPLEASG